jgi:hypothetical protein
MERCFSDGKFWRTYILILKKSSIVFPKGNSFHELSKSLNDSRILLISFSERTGGCGKNYIWLVFIFCNTKKHQTKILLARLSACRKASLFMLLKISFSSK